jgi:hypothetical protein
MGKSRKKAGIPNSTTSSTSAEDDIGKLPPDRKVEASPKPTTPTTCLCPVLDEVPNGTLYMVNNGAWVPITTPTAASVLTFDPAVSTVPFWNRTA